MGSADAAALVITSMARRTAVTYVVTRDLEPAFGSARGGLQFHAQRTWALRDLNRRTRAFALQHLTAQPVDGWPLHDSNRCQHRGMIIAPSAGELPPAGVSAGRRDAENH